MTVTSTTSGRQSFATLPFAQITSLIGFQNEITYPAGTLLFHEAD